MTTILMARHGETDWNRERRWQGHAWTHLNDTGRAQARALAERLADCRLDAVYSSDLPRAFETAEIVAATYRLEPISEPGLREIDVGSLQGLTATAIDGREWDGENQEAHRERVVAALLRIASRRPEGHVLAVTHGGSLRRVQEFVLGEALEVIDNCALWTVTARDGVITALD
jgi:broad specificity phosphatase PhoE